MEKEKIVEQFGTLSPEDKFEVVKSVMPAFCRSMRKEPRRMQEMMKFMMDLCGSDMTGWMGMMGK